MPQPATPKLAADVIIELIDRPERPIVLIERRYAPMGWAIPGGFVEIGETVEHAAMREAREETSLNVCLTGVLGVYSDPTRDPRGHTVSVVYIGTATGIPHAQDDAKHLDIFAPGAWPNTVAFDHRSILSDYLACRAGTRLLGALSAPA
jgi:8-oxo-dGTP diphosphatase